MSCCCLHVHSSLNVLLGLGPGSCPAAHCILANYTEHVGVRSFLPTVARGRVAGKKEPMPLLEPSKARGKGGLHLSALISWTCPHYTLAHCCKAAHIYEYLLEVRRVPSTLENNINTK